MSAEKEPTVADVAGIRHLANSLENIALERYMGSRDNIVRIADILKHAYLDLAAVPGGTKDECEWEWCNDGKCLINCPDLFKVGSNTQEKMWPRR